MFISAISGLVIPKTMENHHFIAGEINEISMAMASIAKGYCLVVEPPL
jgi:hypothetical protein